MKISAVLNISGQSFTVEADLYLPEKYNFLQFNVMSPPILDCPEILANFEDKDSIYLIKCGSSKYKIGFSKNPKARLKQLQTGNPEVLDIIACCPGSKKLEASLHKFFEVKQIKGSSAQEWFVLSDNDVEKIKYLFTTINSSDKFIDNFVDSELFHQTQKSISAPSVVQNQLQQKNGTISELRASIEGFGLRLPSTRISKQDLENLLYCIQRHYIGYIRSCPIDKLNSFCTVYGEKSSNDHSILVDRVDLFLRNIGKAEKPIVENTVVENTVVEKPVIEKPVVENPVVENKQQNKTKKQKKIGTISELREAIESLDVKLPKKAINKEDLINLLSCIKLYDEGKSPSVTELKSFCSIFGKECSEDQEDLIDKLSVFLKKTPSRVIKNIDKLLVTEIKELLEEANLSIIGSKDELKKRLLDHVCLDGDEYPDEQKLKSGRYTLDNIKNFISKLDVKLPRGDYHKSHLKNLLLCIIYDDNNKLDQCTTEQLRSASLIMNFPIKDPDWKNPFGPIKIRKSFHEFLVLQSKGRIIKNIDLLTPKMMKDVLTLLDLPTSGNKEVLKERLLSAL